MRARRVSGYEEALRAFDMAANEQRGTAYLVDDRMKRYIGHERKIEDGHRRAFGAQAAHDETDIVPRHRTPRAAMHMHVNRRARPAGIEIKRLFGAFPIPQSGRLKIRARLGTYFGPTGCVLREVRDERRLVVLGVQLSLCEAAPHRRGFIGTTLGTIFVRHRVGFPGGFATRAIILSLK